MSIESTLCARPRENQSPSQDQHRHCYDFLSVGAALTILSVLFATVPPRKRLITVCVVCRTRWATNLCISAKWMVVKQWQTFLGGWPMSERFRPLWVLCQLLWVVYSGQRWWWFFFQPQSHCQAVVPGFSSHVAHVAHATTAEHAGISSLWFVNGLNCSVSNMFVYPCRNSAIYSLNWSLVLLCFFSRVLLRC